MILPRFYPDDFKIIANRKYHIRVGRDCLPTFYIEVLKE